MGTGLNTTGWRDGAIVPFTYDGTLNNGTGGWIRDFWENSTYSNRIPVIETAASTAAKAATYAVSALPQKGYFAVLVTISNTATSPLTLNISGKGAKPIYIDGAPSGADNFTLPAGPYIVYYDGSKYYFNTNGELQGSTFHGNAITATTADVSNKLGTKTIGGLNRPIYLENGVPKACDNTLDALNDYVKKDAATTPITSYFVFDNSKAKAYGDTLPTSAQNGQVFFKKGNEKPLILRKDYPVTSKIVANTSVPLSDYTGSVITSSTNLEIFHNGILLNSNGSHYAIDTKNNISFKYDIKAGDTLSFVQTTPANTIDLSKYLTTTQGNNYIKKTGDTVSGTLNLQSDSTTKSRIIFNHNVTESNSKTDIPLITFSATNSPDTQDFAIATNHNGQQVRTLKIKYGTNTAMNLQGTSFLDCKIDTIENSGTVKGSKIYGAVWNDYAEYRICKDNFIPGMIVCENGDDTLSISKERMQPAAAVISDTFGFAIGETDDAKCPIAVSGRVLAIPYEPREEFKKAIGKPVCAGPNGTVSIMTDEEYRDKGYCAIGTISAVPDYAIWGTGNVAVNNRIWIKVG